MEQLCSCLRVILGQAKSISEGRKTLIYTVQETSSTSPSPSAVHTVRMAEITEINPITRLIALAESDVLGSNVKAFFMCDLCMFTIDLTSILVTPGAAQKNEMLLSIGKKMFVYLQFTKIGFPNLSVSHVLQMSNFSVLLLSHNNPGGRITYY